MRDTIDRRDFLKGMTAAAAAALFDPKPAGAAALAPSPGKLPRWRGFNLLEKFITSRENSPFRESDFAWMAEWGFDFVRLPMSYWCWSDPNDWRVLREGVLKEIDDAVAFGRRYGIHVCLNFHRAPGYSVDRSAEEPFNLWTDAEALEACVYHWRHFAQRYQGIPAANLSFDLVNEPAMKSFADEVLLDDATYHRVAKVLVEAIREESPERLIIADGLLWGRLPVPALAELGVGQSTRGYDPIRVTHWKAGWVGGSETWPEPAWPLDVTPEEAAGDREWRQRAREVFRENPIVSRSLDELDPAMPWNRERLARQLIGPWKELEAMGVGVHVGEFGCFQHTPHAVALRWMEDMLGLWKQAGWGWALWEFRGTFGLLDSGRADVKYEDFRGHKLDRAMLELLRRY